MATEIDAQFASKTNDFALELYKVGTSMFTLCGVFIDR